MSPLVVGLIIFLVTYALIASERIDKTIAALAGGMAMILFGVVDQEHAFEHIDLNVIFLLAGMMMLAGVIRKTGVFGWMAIRAAKLAGGEPYRILVVLCVVTAVVSALLDNVTTVVLIGPISIFLAARLGISPVPFLVAEIFASNIGGAATLIGDPPNILIGSAARLSFVDFLNHMAPVSILSMAAFLVAARFMFFRSLQLDPKMREQVLNIKARDTITDRPLLRKSLIVLGLTLVAFVLHGPLHLEPATVALAGAVALMLWARQDPEEVLHEVEWPTLFFFVGLFVLVSGVIEVGLIDILAQGALAVTGDAVAPKAMLILWLSAVLSAIVDNIPYTATVIPLVEQLVGTREDREFLWWTLAMGADFGGNMTIIGASANVILAGLAAREGHPIGFWWFFKYGAIVTFGTLVICTIYIWLRYL